MRETYVSGSPSPGGGCPSPSCPPLAAAILGALLAVPAMGAAQQGSEAATQRPDFRADVEMVLLNVAVVGRRGGDVLPLAREDFKVFDNGVEQDIALFLTPTEAALDIALVLDASTSMTPVASTARRAAQTFLGLLQADDCVFALPFNERAGPGRWGKAGDPATWNFIDQSSVGGGTALYDALLAGMATLERTHSDDLVARGIEPPSGEPEGRAADPGPPATPDPEPPAAAATGPPASAATGPPPARRKLVEQLSGAAFDVAAAAPAPSRGCGGPLPKPRPGELRGARRRALVVLTDGADEDSEAGFSGVLAAARAASVPVFPVALGFANEDDSLKARLEELARATGGRIITSLGPPELRAAYQEVVSLLRASYLIGYYPDVAPGGQPDPTAGGLEGESDRGLEWHDVRVELRRPNFVPLVRPGYYR